MDIEQTWEDCSIGFICPDCGAELVADSRNGEEVCNCGTKYYLSVKLVITPSGPDNVVCGDCSKPYPFGLDVTLPNDQWSLIMGQPESKDDPGGVLCVNCILVRAEKLPGVVAARMWLDQPDNGENHKRRWIPGYWEGGKCCL